MQTMTVIYADAFVTQSQQALVLALIEGLKAGANFVVQFGSNPSSLCAQLNLLGQPELKLEVEEKASDQWTVRISKRSAIEETGGCCGMCGG